MSMLATLISHVAICVPSYPAMDNVHRTHRKAPSSIPFSFYVTVGTVGCLLARNPKKQLLVKMARVLGHQC